MPKRFLIKHVGNMGDSVFLVPPVVETLKRRFPSCHITVVTAWGFKDKKGRWGKRNQDGYCIALLMTNPHVDRLIHWHDTALSEEGDICREEGKVFSTWNRKKFDLEKKSGRYDGVWELDFGLGIEDNPMTRMYHSIGLPQENFSNYRLYLTDADQTVARFVMHGAPRPRIVLLEGLESTTTRGWDPNKVSALTTRIEKEYGVSPLWFGAAFVPEYRGRPLSLRENIATLTECDIGIGVLSGALHFAAAVGMPTLTLYADQPLHRAAPAYFLNRYIPALPRHHRTLLGPASKPYTLLKSDQPPSVLTPGEVRHQQYRSWNQPGRQATKAPVAPLTVAEIMTVVHDMLSPNHSV